MNKLSSLVLSAALIALPVSGMAAYEGGDVKDGGTISGTVKFKGSAPKAGCEQGQGSLRENRQDRPIAGG